MRIFSEKFIAIGLLFFFFNIVTSSNAERLGAVAYCVLDGKTQKVVKHQNGFKAYAPASTVKLLTALVAIDRLPLKKVLTTSRQATAVCPIKLGLQTGEQITCQDLLIALLLKSANDAAVVLAEGVAGSQAEFAKLLNERASRIGCKKSHFVTPNGLPARGQYSCAYDLALIAYEASRYTAIREILALKEYRMTINGRQLRVVTHNKMLWLPHPVYGKTGWTRQAGNTFAGFTVAGEHFLTLAVLGSPRRKILWQELATLSGQAPPRTVSAPRHKANQNESAKKIQTLLKRKGFYTGKIDGIFGAKTREAVKTFQKRNGLKVDGIVGPNTLKKLRQ